MLTELNVQADRFIAPTRPSRLDDGRLLASTGEESLHALWARISRRTYAVPIKNLSPVDYERVCPGDVDRILAAADAVLARRVDTLGSGPVDLGRPVDWHRD